VDAMDEAARQSRVLDGEPDARKLLIHHHDAPAGPAVLLLVRNCRRGGPMPSRNTWHWSLSNQIDSCR
jgi:hypothetical protein